jgi:predicted nicotinamide N-methyase
MKQAADPAAFIRANTALSRPPMVPEFELYLASEITPIWEATEAMLEQAGIDPPYWAFCWPGGQALGRYVLDNPPIVANKVVLDFASGCGVAALAAVKAGAAHAIANDIDRLALVAAELNARVNGRAIATDLRNLLAAPLDNAIDVVLAGDVCYEKPMAEQVFAWLRKNAAMGKTVLLGDPGRSYLPTQGLKEIARYDIPTSLQLENRGMKETVVWQVLNASHV